MNIKIKTYLGEIEVTKMLNNAYQLKVNEGEPRYFENISDLEAYRDAFSDIINYIKSKG